MSICNEAQPDGPLLFTDSGSSYVVAWVPRGSTVVSYVKKLEDLGGLDWVPHATVGNFYAIGTSREDITHSALFDCMLVAT